MFNSKHSESTVFIAHVQSSPSTKAESVRMKQSLWDKVSKGFETEARPSTKEICRAHVEPSELLRTRSLVCPPVKRAAKNLTIHSTANTTSQAERKMHKTGSCEWIIPNHWGQHEIKENLYSQWFMWTTSAVWHCLKITYNPFDDQTLIKFKRTTRHLSISKYHCQRMQQSAEVFYQEVKEWSA